LREETAKKRAGMVGALARFLSLSLSLLSFQREGRGGGAWVHTCALDKFGAWPGSKGGPPAAARARALLVGFPRIFNAARARAPALLAPPPFSLSHLERLGGAKLLAGGHEAGHLGLGQLDLQATKVGLGDVLDLVLWV